MSFSSGRALPCLILTWGWHWEKKIANLKCWIKGTMQREMFKSKQYFFSHDDGRSLNGRPLCHLQEQSLQLARHCQFLIRWQIELGCSPENSSDPINTNLRRNTEQKRIKSYNHSKWWWWKLSFEDKLKRFRQADLLSHNSMFLIFRSKIKFISGSCKEH